MSIGSSNRFLCTLWLLSYFFASTLSGLCHEHGADEHHRHATDGAGTAITGPCGIDADAAAVGSVPNGAADADESSCCVCRFLAQASATVQFVEFPKVCDLEWAQPAIGRPQLPPTPPRAPDARGPPACG